MSGQCGEGKKKINPGERSRQEAEGERKYEEKKTEWWNRRAEDGCRYRRGRQVRGAK